MRVLAQKDEPSLSDRQSDRDKFILSERDSHRQKSAGSSSLAGAVVLGGQILVRLFVHLG